MQNNDKSVNNTISISNYIRKACCHKETIKYIPLEAKFKLI